jgi:hypothetical protein
LTPVCGGYDPPDVLKAMEEATRRKLAAFLNTEERAL